jgi:hypothetical protein
LVTTNRLPLARIAARHSGNLSHGIIFWRQFTSGVWQKRFDFHKEDLAGNSGDSRRMGTNSF